MTYQYCDWCHWQYPRSAYTSSTLRDCSAYIQGLNLYYWPLFQWWGIRSKVGYFSRNEKNSKGPMRQGNCNKARRKGSPPQLLCQSLLNWGSGPSRSPATSSFRIFGPLPFLGKPAVSPQQPTWWSMEWRRLLRRWRKTWMRSDKDGCVTTGALIWCIFIGCLLSMLALPGHVLSQPNYCSHLHASCKRVFSQDDRGKKDNPAYQLPWMPEVF